MLGNMILITGGSSGIGECCARAFAAAGRGLVLAARRKDKLEALARELKEKHEIETHALVLDVRSRTAVEGFVRENRALLSRVSVLVNNAGLAKGFDPIQTGNPDDWDAMIDTNVKGLLYVTRAMAPLFIEKKDGHIVNLGSVAGRWIYPKGNVYCATKAAVHALSQAMRLDLHGTGIRVTEISPGMVDETEFSDVRFGDREKARAVYANTTPLTARDVADAVVWSALRPRHVNIQEIVIYPTVQAAPTTVERKA